MVRRRIAGDIYGSRISRRLCRDIIHLFGRWLLPWPGQRLCRTGKHYGRCAVPNLGRPGRRDCLPRPNQRVRGLATRSRSGEQQSCNRANKFLHSVLSKNDADRNFHFAFPVATVYRQLPLLQSFSTFVPESKNRTLPAGPLPEPKGHDLPHFEAISHTPLPQILSVVQIGCAWLLRLSGRQRQSQNPPQPDYPLHRSDATFKQAPTAAPQPLKTSPCPFSYPNRAVTA